MFYENKQDPKLAEDIVSKSTDAYIMVNETPDDDSAVLDLTVPTASVFTPPTSPVWTIDALIGQLVVIEDDNGHASEFVITDNTATSFTVDLESDLNGNDKSANYTDTSTYNFKLWGAEKFLGYTDESSFNDEDENKSFKVDVPRKMVREDLLENTVTLETIVRSVGKDTQKVVYNLDDSDSSTTHEVLNKASNPTSRPFYYLILRNKNVNNKVQELRLFWSQFKPNGARSLGGGDDYENIPAIVTVNSDGLRDDTIGDKYNVRIEK